MTRAAIHAFWAHWRRHPLQLLTLLAGLALATALWTAVQAINAEARASYAQAAARLAGDGDDRLTGTITTADYVALRRAGWLVTPEILGTLASGDQRLDLLGVDVLTGGALAPSGGSEAPPVDPADLLLPPGRLFAAPGTDLSGANLPPVVFADLPPGLILTDIATAQRLLERPGGIDRLRVLSDQPAGLQPLATLAPSLTRERLQSPDTARLTDSFHLNLTAFGLLSFAVGLFIVHGTVGLCFEQRRPLFRTLRALGLPLRALTLLGAGELLLLALLAGLLGLIAGYLIAGALMPGVATTLRGLYGASAPGDLQLRADWIGSGLVMAVLGTALASAQALTRLARLPLLAAPGVQAWARHSARSQPRLAMAGLGLWGAGLGIFVLGDGLVAGFALLAGLLLGAALLLPPILSALLRLGARTARGPIGDWVWSDLRAQLPGLSLALMALLLALAANIGVGTMVQSFRLTFTGWLDQRLMAELYVTARDDAQGAAIEHWAQDRTDAILPIRHVELTRDGAPLFLYGVRDHATYRNHWPLIDQLPGAWDAVAEGRGVLINEQLARRADLWPGDTLALAPDWRLEIAGVYSDYGNPTGQAIVSLPALLARHPDVENRRFGLRIAPQDAPALTAALQAQFDLPAGAMIDQGALKAQSMAVFDRTFVVTGALNLLTLGVAGFAILTSLLTLWSLRLPQIAPVWALGLPRAQLARLEVLRSLALAALTAGIALPLGLMLAWVLLHVINVAAFGWRLPMSLFPLDWLRLLALALLAAGLAALIPARRLYRLPAAQLLKVFADAR